VRSLHNRGRMNASRIPPSDILYGAAFEAAAAYAQSGIFEQTPRGARLIRRLRRTRDQAVTDGFEIEPFEEHWLRDVDANIYLFHLRALAAGNPSGEYDPLEAHKLCVLTVEAIRQSSDCDNPEVREHLSMQVYAALLWQMDAVARQVKCAMRGAEDEDDHEVVEAVVAYHAVEKDVRRTHAQLADLKMPALIIDSVQQLVMESGS
jgi:hypothetical protein